tara:strand:+ start:27 stop:281 length:255 start_codon:yes stop_codon:yes gene_type:complete
MATTPNTSNTQPNDATLQDQITQGADDAQSQGTADLLNQINDREALNAVAEQLREQTRNIQNDAPAKSDRLPYQPPSRSGGVTR